MTDPSGHSGSRWEPSEPVQPVQPERAIQPAVVDEANQPIQPIQPDRPIDPLGAAAYDAPSDAWHAPATPSRRRPLRLALAAGTIALLAAGGVGGFLAGHVTAGDGDGDGDGDGSGVVDRDDDTQQDRGFPDDDGDVRGTPPDLDGDRDVAPAFPDQGQPGTDSDSGSGSSSTGTGSAT